MDFDVVRVANAELKMQTEDMITSDNIDKLEEAYQNSKECLHALYHALAQKFINKERF